HVDTGMGELDHHQDDRDTCAAKLVFEHVLKNKNSKLSAKGRSASGGKTQNSKIEIKHFQKEALERLVAVVNDIDHFRQVYYPEPTADYHQFSLVDILDGLHLVYNGRGSGDIQVVEHGMSALDAIYRVLQNKVHAEKELEGSEKMEVTSPLGKIVGFLTGNDAVLDMAQKMGYSIVVRKDPKKGYVRIKALPEKGIDLTKTYELLKMKDPHATWFLHSSKAMLLNGSTKNPTMRPTTLNLETILMHISASIS
ncbi:hypothetical protein HY468_03225, partial [Candidatus Roizmanbacteria bacterium]|nr:hypothetical protein [Candidatus Roizmanbacteria bacterium]